MSPGVQADLHLHTTRSDGRLAPAELVGLCAARGLKVIAVTDHDTTAGLDEARAACQQSSGLLLIPGIELSTETEHGEVHLLGFFVDPGDAVFQRALSRFRDGRLERARRMVAKLGGLGVAVSWARVLEIAAGASLGRPHIAQAMVEAGHVRYPREAFNRYLARNGPAYVEREKLTPVEAVRLLVDNGALPVLAHPTYSEAKSSRPGIASLDDMLAELQEVGLVGMEVHYGDYSAEETRRLGKLAARLGLVPCGGSDYHGAGNPGEPEPGSVGPPMESVEALLAIHRQPRARR